MAGSDKTADKKPVSASDPTDGAELAPTADAGADGPDEKADADGYKRSRRRIAREGDGDGDKAGSGKLDLGKKGPPPTKYQQFMEEHWEGWLSQVAAIVVLAGGVLGYQLKLLPEGMVGLVLSGGMIAVAIYWTAGQAYDLIENKQARTLFAILTFVWAAAVGYPTVRKAVPRKVLAETVLTEQSKTAKLTIGEGSTGPFDVTVSGSLRSDAGSDKRVDYTTSITGDGGQSEELSGEFTVAVRQARVRRGSTHWTEQNNQSEHRLPRTLRGHELQVETAQLDDLLEDGLHITVHPQSLNPSWFLLAGILVVLAMMFVEARLGDAKTKTHLIMASASTLIFAYHFTAHATPNRLVFPALDSLFLALITGGIGGTLVGAVVRRVSGRDRIKPRAGDEPADDKAKG